MADSVHDRQDRIRYLVGLYCVYHRFNDEIEKILIALILRMMNVYGYDTRIIMQPDMKMFNSWLIEPFGAYGFDVENIILNKLFFNIQDIKLVAPEGKMIDRKIDYSYKTRTVYIDKEAFANLVKDSGENANSKGMQDIKWSIYFPPLLEALQTNFNDGALNENNLANKQYLGFIEFLKEDSLKEGHAKYYREFGHFEKPATYLGDSHTYEGIINYVTFSSNYLDWLRKGEINFIINPQVQAYYDLNDYVTMGIYNSSDPNLHSSNYGVMLMAALGPTRIFNRLYCNDNHPTNDFSRDIFKHCYDSDKSLESLIARIETVLSKVDVYQGTNSDKIKKMIEMELELMAALIAIYGIKLSNDSEYRNTNSTEIMNKVILETALMHNFHLQNRVDSKGIIDFNIFKRIRQNLARIDEIKEDYIKTRTL